MKIPTEREDFVEIGARLDSADIITEIDRLAPIARRDIGVLKRGGYTQARLDELLRYRSGLAAESGERRSNRASKTAARMSEQQARGEGVALLRVGTQLAISTVSERVPPEGETKEQTAEIVTRLSAQIRSLSGILAQDTASVRQRLETLRVILEDGELRPTAEIAEVIAGELAEVRRVLESLPIATETKKAAQQAAIVDTADLDELDGRAYWNLKLLTGAGAAVFRGKRQRDRARPYNLKALNPRTEKKTTT